MKNIDLVIFGGTGDLATRKLLPALYHIYRDGKINDNSRIRCLSHVHFNQEDFLTTIYQGLKKHLHSRVFCDTVWQNFREILEFIEIDVENEKDWQELSQTLSHTNAHNTIYYMAVPPSLFGTICQNLKKFKMNAQHTHIVIEKPLGEDLKSSNEINDMISETFPEKRIYRIDHYLGKIAVHNLLLFRFNNPKLDSIWNKNYINSIQITISETIGVEGRFELLDRIGVLRDMVQNHMMQLLTLIAMDKPKTAKEDDIRNEKAKIANALRPITEQNVENHVVRAQYIGYKEEAKGHAKGTGNTYVAIKTYIDNERWKDVPFYLSTGKRLNGRYIEITIDFKPSTANALNIDAMPNLVLRLQPEIFIKPEQIVKELFNNKCPLNPDNLDINNIDDKRMPCAYETLICDVINEHQSYFVKRDEIEAAWKWIDSIRNSWSKVNLPIYEYKTGSKAPSEIERIYE